MPNRTDTAALIRATALRHGVDPKLALAIGWQESGWNQRAVSYTNAIGVMQIMPISGTWGSQLAGRTLNLYKVEDNITAGVLILRSLQKLGRVEGAGHRRLLPGSLLDPLPRDVHRHEGLRHLGARDLRPDVTSPRSLHLPGLTGKGS